MKKTKLLLSFLLMTFVSWAQMSNYNFSASSGTYTAISGGTAIPSIQADDAMSNRISIGFVFNYDGINYTKILANSNGWITFDTLAMPSGFDQRANNLTSNTSMRPIVAPLWDDLDGTGHSASYITTGTAPNRVFTIEWKEYEWNFQATSPVISFQIKLYETSNNIEFVYKPESGSVSSGSASVGITDTASGTGNFLSLNNLSSTATVSSTSETSSINSKPVSGQTFTFSRCNATMAPINDMCDNSGSIPLGPGAGTPTGGTSSFFINGNSQSTFDPAALGMGVHSVMYVYSVSGCSDTNIQQVRVDTVTPMQFSMANSICSNEDTIELFGIPMGGTFRGEGILSGTNKLFPDSILSPGTKTITYSFTNAFSCSDSVDAMFQFDTISSASVSPPSVVCENRPPVALNSGLPTGGTYFGRFVQGNTYYPGAPGTDTVFYEYQAPNGCSDTTFATVSVKGAPITKFPAIGRFCANASSLILNTATPKGGTYSGLRVTSDSIYQPAMPGVDTIMYKYTNADNCSDSISITVPVDSVTTTSLTGKGPYCDNTPAVTLSGGAPSGGVYKARGVMGTSYSPDQAGAGFDTLYYVVTNNFGCMDSSSVIITVNQKTPVSFSTSIKACEADDEISLTGATPLGGVYGGNGVNSSTGKFDPNAAGEGMHQISYVFTNGSGCMDSASVMATVNSNPVVDLGTDIEICGEKDAELDAGLDSVTYAWSNGKTSRKITVQESKVFTITVTDTTSGCTATDEIRVEYDAICVSIDEGLLYKVKVNYYPNPTNGLLKLSIEGLADQKIELEVFDLTGSSVHVLQFEVNQFNYEKELDLSHLEQGNYILNLRTEEGSVVHRISKY